MKRYMFSVVVDEGQDEFWESIRHKMGGKEVRQTVVDALESLGYFVVGQNVKVSLQSVKCVRGRLFLPRRKAGKKAKVRRC